MTCKIIQLYICHLMQPDMTSNPHALTGQLMGKPNHGQPTRGHLLNKHAVHELISSRIGLFTS